jgi:hypothetical protein
VPGSKNNPLTLNDEVTPGGISEDELDDLDRAAEVQTLEEDRFFFGTVFEKVEDFDHHIDDRNPWHPDLIKHLFPSQIIGFRWMLSRHSKGGGLIGDKVGGGKVLSQCQLQLIIDISSCQFYSRPPNGARKESHV